MQAAPASYLVGTQRVVIAMPLLVPAPPQPMSVHGQAETVLGINVEALFVGQSVQSLLNEVYAFVERRESRRALRSILHRTDEWLLASRFSQCAELLRRADLTRVDDVVALGILTAVRPAREQFADEYLSMARRYREDLERRRPDESATLMKGLD